MIRSCPSETHTGEHISCSSIISLNFPMMYTASPDMLEKKKRKKDSLSHRQSPLFLNNKTILLPAQDLLTTCPTTRWCKVKCMSYMCVCGYYIRLNECPSVSTEGTSRDGSRWRIVGRRTAAESHTPSDRSVPHTQHSLSFRSPTRTVRHWPVCWYVRFGVATVLQGSTGTAESGSGGGNKQDSWVVMFTLISFHLSPSCTNALLQHLGPYLRNWIILKHKRRMLNRTLLERHSALSPKTHFQTPFYVAPTIDAISPPLLESTHNRQTFQRCSTKQIEDHRYSGSGQIAPGKDNWEEKQRSKPRSRKEEAS